MPWITAADLGHKGRRERTSAADGINLPWLITDPPKTSFLLLEDLVHQPVIYDRPAYYLLLLFFWLADIIHSL